MHTFIDQYARKPAASSLVKEVQLNFTDNS